MQKLDTKKKTHTVYCSSKCRIDFYAKFKHIPEDPAFSTGVRPKY